MELCNKYRPASLDEVVGQDAAVKAIKTMKRKGWPNHALLFTGPSGCGKTTLAKIIADQLNVHPRDLRELDCGVEGGKDSVREIRDHLQTAPVRADGKRMWILDEAHGLSSAAQDAILVSLENAPDHVYIALCTTMQHKLKRTIHTRCTEVQVKRLHDKKIGELLRSIWASEGNNPVLSDEVVERIVMFSDGSARQALKHLEKIITFKKDDDMLEAIMGQKSETQAHEIARALLDTRTKWSDMVKLLKNLEDDPEKIRRIVLTIASAKMLESKPNFRAKRVVSAFCDAWYNEGQSNHIAYLRLACWEIINVNLKER